MESQGWEVVLSGAGDHHGIPVDDACEHEDSRYCLCDPRFEKIGSRKPADRLEPNHVIVIHTAYDGRE